MVTWGDNDMGRLVHTWSRMDGDIYKCISIATITASNRYLKPINPFNQLNKSDIINAI